VWRGFNLTPMRLPIALADPIGVEQPDRHGAVAWMRPENPLVTELFVAFSG